MKNCSASDRNRPPFTKSRQVRPHAEARCTPRASGRMTRSILAPSPRGPEGQVQRRRRTWTHSSTEGRSKGAHAVEFSKTVAPHREGSSLPRARLRPRPVSGRTGNYSVEIRALGKARNSPRSARRRWMIAVGDRAIGSAPLPAVISAAGADLRLGLTASPSYETTCTVTVRVRGRSSKSISTTCCQVPSARWPSTSGIVSEGPITAARRCA